MLLFRLQVRHHRLRFSRLFDFSAVPPGFFPIFVSSFLPKAQRKRNLVSAPKKEKVWMKINILLKTQTQECHYSPNSRETVLQLLVSGGEFPSTESL